MLAHYAPYLILLFAFAMPGDLLSILSLPGQPIQNKGDLFISGGGYAYNTSHFWNKHGKRLPAFNDFHKRTYSVLAEYGLTAKDTIGLQDAYGHIKESLNSNTMGFADAELSWKHLFHQCGPDQFIAKIAAIIPVAHIYKPGLRYGRFGVEIDCIYLHRFAYRERCGWCQAQLGYRYYQGFPSDQIVVDCSAGYHLFPCFQLVVDGCLEYGTFNGKFHVSKNMILFDPNFRLFKLEIQGILRVYRALHASIGYYRHMWGNNVGTGGGAFATAYVLF